MDRIEHSHTNTNTSEQIHTRLTAPTATTKITESKHRRHTNKKREQTRWKVKEDKQSYSPLVKRQNKQFVWYRFIRMAHCVCVCVCLWTIHRMHCLWMTLVFFSPFVLVVFNFFFSCIWQWFEFRILSHFFPFLHRNDFVHMLGLRCVYLLMCIWGKREREREFSYLTTSSSRNVPFMMLFLCFCYKESLRWFPFWWRSAYSFASFTLLLLCTFCFFFFRIESRGDHDELT